jgi:hypothetical protein
MRTGPITIHHSRITLLALALLAGCATTADVETAKRSWHGATYDEVVAAWGAPVSETTLADGSRAHTWISESGGSGATVGAYGGSGGGGIGISLPLPGMGGTISGRCERTLSFKGGRVVDQVWHGTTRYCSIFGRY